MTCPRGKSWTNVLPGSNWDHLNGDANVVGEECSDGGICDTATGECSCFAGYEGSACQRTVCPNDCSGHGTCRSNQDFAIDYSEAVFKQQKEIRASNIPDSYYDYFLVTYDNAWDANKQYGCLCDIGFRGPDCSEIECPTAPDAMDEETCVKYSEWERWGTYASNANALGSNQSPSLYGQGNNILIREWDAPARGNITVPYTPIEEFPCNGAPAGDYCSGRGICDTTSGVCQCFSGFTGTACEEVAEYF